VTILCQMPVLGSSNTEELMLSSLPSITLSAKDGKLCNEGVLVNFISYLFFSMYDKVDSFFYHSMI